MQSALQGSIQRASRRFRDARPGVQLAWLALFAFVFRLGMVGLMPPAPMNPDYAEYERLAQSLIERGEFGFGPGWRDDARLANDDRRFLYQSHLATSRPPGYPLVLAGIMSLGFEGQGAFQVVAVVAETINLLIIVVLAVRLFGRTAGGMAGIMWLCMPRSYAYIVSLVREPYITLLFLLGIALVLCVPTNRSKRLAAASGLCFGLGTYFKETVILMIVPVCAWLIFLSWKERKSSLIACAGVLSITAVLATAPWVVRNSIVLGEVSGFSNFGWFNVKRALVDPAWLESQPAEVQHAWQPSASMPAQVVDRMIKSQVVAYAKSRPIETVLAMVGNSLAFWSPVSKEVLMGGKPGVKDIVSGVYNLGYCLLAFLCFWRVRQRPETHLILLTLAFVTLVHSMFPGYPRFRYPYDSLLIVFAAGELHYRWLNFRGGPVIKFKAEP